METKVCSECGHELPIKYFHTWIRKDGTIGVLHQCLKCQRQKANKIFYEKKKKSKISMIETYTLVQELKDRGFIVKLKKENEI